MPSSPFNYRAALRKLRAETVAVVFVTDHHFVVGRGAQEFARALGFEIHDDLNTAASRELWLEWRRRVDPSHWPDPEERLRNTGRVREDTDPDTIRRLLNSRNLPAFDLRFFILTPYPF